MENLLNSVSAETKKIKDDAKASEKSWEKIAIHIKSAKASFGSWASGGQKIHNSGENPNGGGSNVAPMATAKFGHGITPGPFGRGIPVGKFGEDDDGGGGRSGLGRAAGGVAKGMFGAIALSMPDTGDALDYRLARANGAFQMGGLGISRKDRDQYVSGMQRKAMSAGTSMGTMDAVNAQRTLAAAGYGPGSASYGTMMASASGISNIMPGIGIDGGAAVSANFQSAQSTNTLRAFGIQTKNMRTGEAYGMNVIGEQFYQKVMDRQRSLGVTDPKEQQRRINFALQSGQGLDRMLDTASGGDAASKEALKTMIQYRMQPENKGKPLTLLDKKTQEDLGVQTDDTRSQSRLNSRGFDALQSQSQALADGFRKTNSVLGQLQNTVSKLPPIFGMIEGGLGSLLGGLLGGMGAGSVGKAFLGMRALSMGKAALAGKTLQTATSLGTPITAVRGTASFLGRTLGRGAAAMGAYALYRVGKDGPAGYHRKKDYDLEEEWNKVKIHNKRNLTKNPNEPPDGVPSGELSTVRLGKQSWQVSSQHAAKFQGFLNDAQEQGLITGGGKITSSGGYNDRNIAGSNRKSNHAFGAAIDVNDSDNQLGWSSGTVVPGVARALSAKWGLRWGGDYKKRKDFMHFEVAGANGEAGGVGKTAVSAAQVSSTGAKSYGARAFSVGSTNNVLNQMSSKSGVQNAYDCSSYVQEIMKQNGIMLPDTSWEQAKKGTQVYNITEATKGDLLFFHFSGGHKGDGSTNKINHVGIYVGDGRMTDYTKERGASTGYIPMGNLVMIRRVLTSANAVGSSAAPGSTGGPAGAQVAAGGRSGGGSPHGSVGSNSSMDTLLNSLERLESGGKNIYTRAKGSSASGYFQITKPTWNNFGGYGSAIDAPRDVQRQKAQSILSANLKQFGSTELALAAYFAGAGNSKAKLQSLIDSDSSPTAGTKTANMGVGSYVRKILNDAEKTTSRAVGGWNIPQDEFSRLHAGEMVLPSKIAEAVRGAMKEGSGSKVGASTTNGPHKIEVTLIVKGNTPGDYDQALAGITSAVNRSVNYDLIRNT